MLSRVAATLVLAVGLLVAVAGPCGACSCAALPSRAEAVAQADVVFRGTVHAIEDPEGRGPAVSSMRPLLVTFVVDEAVKGGVGRDVTVTTAADEASCGASFARGGRYEVMARSVDGELTTGLCSGNTALPALEGGPEGYPDDVGEPASLDGATAAEPSVWRSAVPVAAAVAGVVLVVLLVVAVRRRGGADAGPTR